MQNFVVPKKNKWFKQQSSIDETKRQKVSQLYNERIRI